MANNTVATVSPSTQPTQNTVAMPHEVLSRPQKRLASSTRASLSGSSLSGSRRLRRYAQAVTADKMPNTTTNSAPICCVVVRSRKKRYMGFTPRAAR